MYEAQLPPVGIRTATLLGRRQVGLHGRLGPAVVYGQLIGRFGS